MYLAAAVLAAASPAPVEVVSQEVVLARHDRARVVLRCNRSGRPCRGVLTLGVPRCGGPALDPRCLVPLGRRSFAIGARATRRVVVPRNVAGEHVAGRPDALVVHAAPSLRRRAPARITRPTREVRLVAPASLARPALALELRFAERLVHDRHAVRFEAAAPRGTTSVTVQLDGRSAELHPRGSGPYVVGRRSFAVAGTIWHGELPVAEGELRAGERVRYRLLACDDAGCTETPGEITLGRDRSRDPQPICRLRPLTAVV